MEDVIMKLKLGLDIGIASVGWGIIDENYDVKDSGVRLFSEGTAKANETRRVMRGQRRRLRRQKHRLYRMGKLLSDVLNIDYPEIVGNIYEIRCRGIKEPISTEELYLAIMYLTKFRGTHFLTAEDFQINDSGENLSKVLANLDDKEYVCNIQYKYFLEHGEIRGTERNHFRNKDYKRELDKLLQVQAKYHKELSENICKEIETIYSSKREYYEGPGSEKSPTPYGCWRYDEHGEKIQVNIIDEMRGYCTYFAKEKRIAKQSYTACLFNLLNDLNNLLIDGRKITYEEKKKLITDYIDNGKPLTEKIIKKVLAVKNDISGYRVDSKGKAIFTKFEGYNSIIKVYKDLNIDDTLIKGNREMMDKIAEILTKEKNIEKAKAELINIGLEAVADELVKLPKFTQYHSLSKKAMELILDDLWHESKNQMQLFNEAGMKPEKNSIVKGKNIKIDMSEWIVSPVTLRAVNETIKVINAARDFVRKKYNQEFAEIIVEMPRDKNSDEQKKRILKAQKLNESQHKAIQAMVDGRNINGKIFLLLRLLQEQDFKCAYSGKSITVADVLNGIVSLEVDHIIPISVSFDDSLSNKVAVLREENQNKGQRTPYQYFNSGRAKISWQEYRDNVLNNKTYSNKKKANLLYEGDLNKDLLGFVGRNLSDTRYASRKVLNTLQEYFKMNEIPTKVKVVNGAFTHQFRKKAKLSKNREETFAHHAQDALIIAGLSNVSIMKVLGDILTKDIKAMDDKTNLLVKNGKVINQATGEILSEDDFSDKTGNYIRFIKHVENRKQKYSHKVDRKPNRQLYAQQVKGTRVRENNKGTMETWIVTKYKDIYSTAHNNSGIKLADLIRKKKEPEKLLMYQHDYKTYEVFKKIVENYPDEKNPFAAYKADYGYIRKYAKKGNGPIINDVKFLEKKLGNHRVNTKIAGSNKSVYLSIKTLRADVYLQAGKYSIIDVLYDMLDCTANGYVINKVKYALAKQKKKLNNTAEFCFSLYNGERFDYKDKAGICYSWIYSCIADGKNNKIEVKFIDKPSPAATQAKRLKTIGINVYNMVKYNVDILGNEHPIKKEKFVDHFTK